MRKKIIILIFFLPFLVIDVALLPIALTYWLISGRLMSPFMQQLFDDDDLY